MHDAGVVRLSETELIFLKDFLFTSPSAAGGVIVGGSNNGRTSWRNADGKSINDLEAVAIANARTSRITPERVCARFRTQIMGPS